MELEAAVSVVACAPSSPPSTPPLTVLSTGPSRTASVAAVAARVRQLSEQRGPPPEAHRQVDGSFVLAMEDGSTLRWASRPDGTFRLPERTKAGHSLYAVPFNPSPYSPSTCTPEVHAARDDDGRNSSLCRRTVSKGSAVGSQGDAAAAKIERMKGRAALARAQAELRVAMAERTEQLIAAGEPCQDAEEQPDGSFLVSLEDRSTLRWTRRPNGSWRKPEHKKAGWVGDLEQERYLAPALKALKDREGQVHSRRLGDLEREPCRGVLWEVPCFSGSSVSDSWMLWQ